MVVNSTAVCGQGQGDLSMVVVLWHKVQLSSCRLVMRCRDWLFVLLCNSCWKMLLTIVLLCTVPLLVGEARATGMQRQAPFVELLLKYNAEKYSTQKKVQHNYICSNIDPHLHIHTAAMCFISS